MGQEESETDIVISLAKEAVRCAQELVLNDKWAHRASEAYEEFRLRCTPFTFLEIMGYLPKDK
jgi:hypothetical protein